MGKKGKRSKKAKILPFVSVCTPTFNRRPFWETIIKCFQLQDYPMHLIEWVIIDDGSDPIEDLVKDVPQVKYFKYDKKMTLGVKRNLMHTKSRGDILVYMDDDDYYPPNRISHAVEKLQKNPAALCAGSSIMSIYYYDLNKIYQLGPYGPNHATANTFAMRREILKITKYNVNSSLAEEKEFLKNYTIPFVQLDTDKTCLCFCHSGNTFDKHRLLEQDMPGHMRKIDERQIGDWIEEPVLLKFFKTEVEDLLKNYEPGDKKYKPDVLKQQIQLDKAIDEMRKERAESQPIMIEYNGKQTPITKAQTVEILQGQQKQIAFLQNQLQEAQKRIQELEALHEDTEATKDVAAIDKNIVV
jgi:glycosyltransferase involved in cell wall biosynthesis